MFKPLSDFMIVERYRDVGKNIVLPETSESSQWIVYVVKAIGPGQMMDNGELYKSDVAVGDKVIIVGKVLKASVGNKEILFARGGDVVARERVEPIPDKI